MWWSRGRHRSGQQAGSAAPVGDLATSLAAITEPQALHELVLRRFLEISGYETARLYVLDEVGARLARAGANAKTTTDDADHFDARGPLAHWLRSNGECLVVDAAQDVLTYLDLTEREILRAVEARVCVPLASLTDLAGVLLLIGDAQRREPTADELALWCFCGRQAGLACESLRAHRADRDRIEKILRADQLVAAGQLAAGVAHEVRNPLTAIRSALQQVLASGDYPVERNQLLQIAIEEVDRINATIASVLTLSKPAHLQPEPLDLAAIAEDAVRLMRPYADERGLAIDVDLQRRPLDVTADRSELRQVFVNLMLNACQATTAPARIHLVSDVVVTKVADGPHETLACIRVADGGCGMTREQMDRAFDLFYTTKGNGTGLGLPICLGIVRRHGGFIQMESTLGAGTTVSVLLPLREPTP